MKEIDLAYFPIIGRGEQIKIICAMHDIKVNNLHSSPMGDDFNTPSAISVLFEID